MKNANLRQPTGVPATTGSWQRSLRRQALWAALTLALGAPVAQAQTVTDGGTHTSVIAAPNGVPVVNIAAPNGAGVSHNTYQQFNVGSNGLILNNSGTVSNTQLAGYIGGNPNLGAGQGASLIINEVTSTAPSQLNGAMEVAGRAAQVVVANPNGISCSGCGFINAPRGTLTTGRPLFAGDGSLNGLAVTGGTITVGGQGMPSGSTDQLDLLARAVAINAGVWARQLNVITGPNRVDYATLATQPLAATGATPGVALDVSALGGMYANAIRLVGTEAGLGVNSQGEIIAQNGDLTLTSAGQVVLGGKTTATGNVTVTAAQSLTNQGTLAGGGSVTVGSADFTNQGVLYANNAITLSANGAVSNSGQIEAQSGALSMQAQGAITGTTGSSMYAGGPVNLSGASFANAGKLESAQGLSLQVSGDAANSGSLSADAGDFNLSASTIENTGNLAVGGNAALSAATSLANSGVLVANDAVTLTAPSLSTAGTVQAGTALDLSGNTLTNSGKLYALGGSWTATVGGAFVNQAGGDMYTGQGLVIQATSLANAGSIEAQQAGALTLGGAFSNSGTLQSDQAGLVLAAASLANTGTVSAYGNLRWQIGTTAQNSGVLVSGGAIDGASGSFANLAGGQLQSGTGLMLTAADVSNAGAIDAKGDATFAGSSLSNASAGQVLVAGALTVGEAGSVSNAGVLQAGSDFTLTRAASLTNAAGATLYAGQDLNFALSQALTNAGTVYAARTASLAAGGVDNTGTLRSDGTLSLASTGDAVNSGAIQAQQSVSLVGGADVTNSGKLYVIDGGLTVQAQGVFGSASTGDIYSGQDIGLRVGSFANAGTLEATQSVNLVAQGSASNSGVLQADHGNLAIAGDVLSNQGTLSAAGTTQLTSAGSLGNEGKLVTGQTLAMTASGFTNSGQIQSGGTTTLQAASIVNGGLLQAGGSLGIDHNVSLTNQSGGSLLAAGNVSTDTSSLLTNGGVIQAGGNLAIEGAGAISNARGATLYGTQLTTLQLGGGLSNAGTVYGAQGVNLTAANLDNGGSLRSGAALDVTTQAAATNAGTSYAAGTIDWTIGGALTNNGVLAADGNVTLQAASLGGSGTLAAGLQANGALGSTGDLAVTTAGNLVANGRSLAAGNLRFAGSAIDLTGSQTRASNITLTASQGDVTNAGGDLAANDTVAITTRASLVNGGATAAQGGAISAGTLALQVAALDNRDGTLIQTGSTDLTLALTGAFANANGSLVTNAHNLTVSAVSVDNSTGTIQDAGNGTLTLTTPGDLTNTGGRIAGNGALALQTGGVLGNDGGLLSVAGNVTATAGRFDNVHGTLIGQDLGLTVAQALTNTGGGTIQAGGALQLDTGSLDNTAGYLKVTDAQSLTLTTSGVLTNGAGGFIGGNGAATITAGSLANAGQVYAGSSLGVTTQGLLTNNGGALQAQGTASIASGGALSNRGGRIEAGSGTSAADLSLRAASLDNTAGRIANAGQGSSTFTIAQGAINEGGTLGGQGALTLNAASLDNRQAGKLVAGQTLTLGLGSLDNTAGSVYAASDLGWTNGGASLENAQGSLQSGGNLTLDLASLDNAGGTIATNQSGNLSLGGLTGLGKVAAGQDLSLTLGGSYTNVAGSQLSANRNLTLNVAGNFGNAAGATLQAVNQLTVNAANIDNAAGATLNGATTVLATGGALSNEGSIEGNTITLSAGSLTNTANIIGGSVTATARSLTNGADLGTATGNNPYQSALIAAANGIDLYVSGTLLNRDATIFTLGDLTIGANASGGASQAVTNLSGDMEANGGIAIDANQFTNQRRVFQTTTYNLTAAEQAKNTTSVTLARYVAAGVSSGDSGQTPPAGTDPSRIIGASEYSTVDNFCNNFNSANSGSQRCDGYPFGIGQPNTFQGVYTSTVTAVQRILATSAQSKLAAGGDITLNGSVLNDKSTIAAGNNLIVNGQSGSAANALVQNIAFEPTATVQTTVDLQSGTQVLVWSPSRAWVGGPWVSYGSSTSSSTVSLAAGQAPGWVSYNPGSDAAAVMSAGNTVSITAHSIDNTAVGANGQPVQSALGLGSNSAGQSVGGSGAGTVANATGHGGSVGAVAVGSAPGQSSGGSLGLAPANTVDGAPAQGAASGSTASVAAPQVVGTLVGPNASVRLPQTGLYTINVQPGSQFLVETNPQFTQYNNFISSNYLLQQLGLNPAQTEQRLGDGFYEQQQVLDQITDLTGRRYLTDNTDALDQYRDLMNNATQVAKQFNLSVGVALTPAQMASLTQDIVWLVSVNVDGHQVLEPVVYLSAADAKNLAASGATIAGKNVILTARGDITNNGSIAASQNAQLTASNLLNSGAISAGGDLSLTAAQDILNGGTLHAGGNVSLVAGNDVLSGVNVAQGLGAVALPGLGTAMGPVALTNLALPGSISAGGNLSIAVGRDLSLDMAPVMAGSNLSLAAGRDLTATATAIHAGGDAQLLAGRDLSLSAISSTNRLGTTQNSVETTTHTVDTVQAGGTLSVLAGHDLVGQGAQLTGATLNLAAGHDVNLQAVTDSTTRTTQGFQGHTLVSTGQTDQNVRGTTLTGSNGLGVSAGHDLTITAGQLSSANGNVALAAGHDLTLAAAQEDHSSYRDTVTAHSGLFSSSKTTTHDATSDSYAIGTAVSGNNVTMMAGHDLTTQAAQLTAAQGLALSAGHDVTLGAGEQTHTSEHSEKHTSSSLFNTGATRFGSLDPEQYSRTSQSSTAQTWSIGSTLSGDTVTVAAGHDLTGTAVQIAGTHDVTLAAGNDLTLNAGKDTYSETDGTKVSRTGLMNGGGFSALIGNRATQAGNTVNDVSYTGSLVGSTNGAVTLSAGHDVHITGSDVLSQTATTIVGQNVTIDAAVGSTDTTQTQSVHTGGINVGIGGAAAGLAATAYHDVQGASQGSSDSRLKALYAAKAAYDAKDLAGMSSQGLQGASKSNPNGINLQVGIGGSTASSRTATHDETTYGSAIRSAGDVTIAATNGDLNVIGSRVDGQNVALAASHDLNLLSQAEQHTLKSTNKNASGGVGLQIGTDGIGFYAQASVGKGKAHGNGTTHTDTVVNATDTLSLVAGNDATIQGAQAKGNTVLADIGHNLNVTSEQDTGDYASTQWQASGKVVIGYGSGASGSISAGKVDSHYKSVTEASGIQAGAGGYQIHVGDTTHLVGGQLASTADPSRNLLDTGSLIAESVHNESKYSAVSVSVSGGTGAMAGGGGGLSTQNHDASSDTQSGLAAGTVTIRNHPGQDLSGINLAQTTLDANGIKNGFDAQKVAQQQELGSLAGYVGMRSVGALASYMADHATTVAEQKAWSAGGTNEIVLHGLVGAATAALGGGNATQGALGAAASEAASGAMGNYLANHGIDPNGSEGKTLMQLASMAIGGAVGGGTGAATALQGEQYNRELHPDEIKIIDDHAEDFAKKLYGNDPTPDQIKDADSRLLAQADRDVNGHNDGLMDTAAESYITGLTAQYGGQTLPGGQHYFYAIGDDYFNDALYAGTLTTPGGQAAYQQIADTHMGVPYAYPNEEQFHQVLSQQNALTDATNASAALQAGLVLCGASDGALCAGVVAGASGSSLYEGAKQVSQGHSTGWVGVAGGALGLAGLTYGKMMPLLPTGAKAVAIINTDGTLTLAGDSSGLNAVSDFDQMAKGTPATPTPGGYLNQAKVCGSQCVLNITDAGDQALATKIAQDGDPTGELTESLVNSVASKQGMKVLAGGKYAGNKGFDAVLQNADGSVTIVIDAKQMTNGTFSLGKTNSGLQLSPSWIKQVMRGIDEASPAYKAIEQARDNGTLNTAVVGVNKQTGQLIGVPVNVPSSH